MILANQGNSATPGNKKALGLLPPGAGVLHLALPIMSHGPNRAMSYFPPVALLGLYLQQHPNTTTAGNCSGVDTALRLPVLLVTTKHLHHNYITTTSHPIEILELTENKQQNNSQTTTAATQLLPPFLSKGRTATQTMQVRENEPRCP